MDPGNADAPALFSWNGPSLGGEVYSHVSMWIYATGEAPTLGAEYQAITVPGATKAHMWTGPTGGGQASITVDVHIVAGSRYINLNAAVAPGAAGEQIGAGPRRVAGRRLIRQEKDPPRTRQSPLILAAFRPWGGSQDDATRGVWHHSRGMRAAARRRRAATVSRP